MNIFYIISRLFLVISFIGFLSNSIIAQSYPVSKGLSTGYDYISKVVFNDISNASTGSDADGDGNDGYDDFTNLSTTVVIGNTYTLSVTIHVNSPDYISAWIDWNDDGDFTDSGEEYVVVTNTNSAGPHTVNITIPSGVVAKRSLRMRVTLKYNGIPASDETFSYGEVEDYTVAPYIDTDDDGVMDIKDIDDDNDGITDAAEAGVSCTTTEVYCGGNNGHIYKIDLNDGSVTLMTTSTQTTGYINALASNPDDGVVYYGKGASMYVYDPSNGTHALLKDFSSEITGAKLESGGGAYFNGYLYIAPEDVNGKGTYLYKIPISNNGLTAGTAVSIGNPSGTNKGYGDFVIINEGSAGIMYGRTSDGTVYDFWKYDLSTNTRTLIKTGSGRYRQFALDLYGRLWRANGDEIQKIDFEGNTYGNIVTATEYIADLTGPFNCVQGDLSKDNDGDGTPNRIDLDSDNDGIADVVEAGGIDGDNDGIIGSGTFDDTDGDGWSNITDSDNGGTILSKLNTDSDAYPNYLDIDSDNDGIVDIIEGQLSSPYTAPSGNDANDNAWDDAFDGNAGGVAIALVDTDGDGKADYIDTNSDDDGGDDATEAYDIDKDGVADTNPTNNDSDADGLDDAYDSDASSSINNGGPTNNNQTANSFPNDDNSTTAERDWREGLSTFPVSLISFKAKLIMNYVELKWVTASETTNDYFLVQKSLDNVTYENIDKVKGNGNSNIIINYESYDMYLQDGVNYYRLKQVDYDGKFTYSNIESVRNIKGELIHIFPNPSNGNYIIDTKESIDVVIYNSMGQDVLDIHLAENTKNNIDMSSQPKGVYFITYVLNNELKFEKIIIK